ncbi:anti-sigma factor domain-containing protein [Halobacillus mangrovi]|uniref:anti-sigma factor domain-containing protein n=1 Tax=Halobacillus mangrovi TaxID=402384 RepID=UPI003D963470
MRKGIVMEQKKEYTIVMTHDGRFHRARRLQHAEVGMEVHFQALQEKQTVFQWTQIIDRSRSHFKVVIITLALLLAFFPMYSWYGSNQAYAYVNIDINPSVELKLNDKMQVLDISPKNEQAEEVLANLNDWKKRDASEVAYDMINLSREKGYVNSDNRVLIGISYIQSNQVDEYSKQMEQFLAERSTGMTIATFLVPEKIRQKANESDQSVNAIMAERIDSRSASSTEENVSEVSITVEDDDKEIIQSFYKKTSPSSDEVEDSIKDDPIGPKASNSLDNQKHSDDQHSQPKEKANPGKGNETAPGQLKKQESSPDQKSTASQSKSENTSKDKSETRSKSQEENPGKDEQKKKSTIEKKTDKSKSKNKVKNESSISQKSEKAKNKDKEQKKQGSKDKKDKGNKNEKSK